MSNEKALTLDRSGIVSIVQFVLLVGIATTVPLFQQQMITGPVVNATLFVSTILFGMKMGILVGLIPSVIALSVGTLPAPLAPMIPYIMMSNAILILTFSYLKEKGYWIAVIMASFSKFLFLFLTSSVVFGIFMKKELADSVAVIMSYPQFITALAGGALAWIFFKKFK